MTAYQLPALRVHRAYDAVLTKAAKTKRGEEFTLREALEVFVDKLEEGSARWGNACAEPGCHLQVQYSEVRRGYECPVHGFRQYAKLLVAWEPLVEAVR